MALWRGGWARGDAASPWHAEIGERDLAVYTSTLRRTIETARPLVRPTLEWRALDEIDSGDCDGMTYDEIRRLLPTEYEAREIDKFDYRYPRGESYRDVIRRLEPVIVEIERERTPVLVVSHQAVLRALYAYLMDRPPPRVPAPRRAPPHRHQAHTDDLRVRRGARAPRSDGERLLPAMRESARTPLAIALTGSIACGPSAQRLAAEDSVRTGSRAVAEVHSSGGESPAVQAALTEAEAWLAHSEEAVSEWGTGPRSLAWETMAPCLARSLGELRDALRAEGREIPADLDAAEAAAAGVTSHTCPRPEAPR